MKRSASAAGVADIASAGSDNPIGQAQAGQARSRVSYLPTDGTCSDDEFSYDAEDDESSDPGSDLLLDAVEDDDAGAHRKPEAAAAARALRLGFGGTTSRHYRQQLQAESHDCRTKRQKLLHQLSMPSKARGSQC
jgi:hypothetical protein